MTKWAKASLNGSISWVVWYEKLLPMVHTNMLNLTEKKNNYVCPCIVIFSVFAGICIFHPTIIYKSASEQYKEAVQCRITNTRRARTMHTWRVETHKGYNDRIVARRLCYLPRPACLELNTEVTNICAREDDTGTLSKTIHNNPFKRVGTRQ